MPLIPLTAISMLSGYGLYLSYQNITRLRQYEEQSERAAKWSNTIAERLHKTRTTQASGTFSLLISFVTAVYLILATTLKRYHFLAAAVLNAGILISSRTHMANFWNDRTQIQVPFVEKFNEAIKGSEAVVHLLELASYTWALGGMLWSAPYLYGTLWVEVGFVVGFGLLWMNTRNKPASQIEVGR